MVTEPGQTGRRRTGVVMKEKRKRGLTIRLGPLGLSLLAAAITAVGLAAVSLADNGSNTSGNAQDDVKVPAPPPGADGGVTFHSNLSDADEQKMEDFRKCMEVNGAPGPPTQIDPSDGPPEPPTAADREKIQKAYEACKDNLPENMRNAGPPGIATFKCGPPPGAPEMQKGANQDQSNDSGTRSSGSSS
jgi:hypothetical protein